MTPPHPLSRATQSPVRCLAVVGPTATGKTRLAVELARRFNGDIVSADSRQVYRGMDIGTGKDVAEYGEGEGRVPVHLLDVADPREVFNLHRYVRLAREAIANIATRNRLPVICGGSHLYVDALIRNYELPGGPPRPEFRAACAPRRTGELAAELARLDPERHARTDLTQRKRVIRALEIASQPEDAPPPPPDLPLMPLLLGPYYPRPDIHARIAARLDARIDEGLLEEVATLHKDGVSWQRLEFLGLEYRFAARHLRGDIDRNTFRDQLLAAIRRFCKAQEIWLRKLEREGWTIHWIPGGDVDEAAELVEAFLADRPLPRPEIRLDDRLYGPRTNG